MTSTVILDFTLLCKSRGLRCLFGDQNIFCRARDFAAVGGNNGDLAIMEDLDLVIRLHMAGHTPAGTTMAPFSQGGAFPQASPSALRKMVLNKPDH